VRKIVGVAVVVWVRLWLWLWLWLFVVVGLTGGLTVLVRERFRRIGPLTYRR